jgi:cation diffusion facilitator family transporter
MAPPDPLDTSAAAIRVTQISLIGLTVTALLQAAVVLLSGSIALLADTAHNLVDALTAVPLWVAFALGRRRATRRFTYGYSRAEDVAGALVVAAIIMSAVLIAYEAIGRIADPHPVERLWLVAVAALIGFAGNEAVALLRIRVGRAIHSAALIADGQHARADGLTSLSVLLGAAGVAAGVPWADPAVGLMIALAILYLAREPALEVWQRLLDGVSPALTLQLEEAAASVEGVDIRDVRARWSGHRLFVEVDAIMDEDVPLATSHAQAEELRHRVLHAHPRVAAVMVHVDPCGHGGGEPHQRTAHHLGPSAS